MTFLGDTAHEVKPSACLACGHEMDAATGIAHDNAPKPGDITLCIRCGHIMAFGDGLALRELTDKEAHEIAGDRRILDVQRARAIALTEPERSS